MQRFVAEALRAATLVVVASLLIVASPPSAAHAEPLALPLLLSGERSLSDQFGYAPDYQRNVPAFDSQNRPYIRSRTASQDGTSFVTCCMTRAGRSWG